MNITLFDQNTLVLLFVAFLGVFIWRYLGVIYSKKIENESIAAKTVNSIAYGMTTAIVCKIVFFPDNALNLIPTMDRIIPFFIGISVFLFFSRNTNLGLLAGISSFSIFIIFRNYLI
jgi:branched-subunit amino acid transport protein|tara:strand:+ start:858 stop:1208 length:351 start_codon:yes stop_codon:yes gene_type:complete